MASREPYARHQEKILSGIPYDFYFPPEVNVAYPPSRNGVWVSSSRLTGERGRGRGAAAVFAKETGCLGREDQFSVDGGRAV